jgi:hypothetical protein
MNLEAKREAVKSVNPRKSWWQKVEAMTDAQITVIYRSLKAQDKVK